MSNCKLLHTRNTEHEIVRRWRRTKLTAVPRLDVLALHLLGFYLKRTVMQRGLAEKRHILLGLLQLKASVSLSCQLAAQL